MKEQNQGFLVLLKGRGDLLFISGRENLDGQAVLHGCFNLDVLPIRNYRLILEFRAQDPHSRNFRDVVLIGWTCIDLFNEKFQPDYGKWYFSCLRLGYYRYLGLHWILIFLRITCIIQARLLRAYMLYST